MANTRYIRKIKGTDGSDMQYFSLPDCAQDLGVDLDKIPYSVRYVAESVLRNQDGNAFTEQDLKTVLNWTPDGESSEIPYMPARVILQDFTGVPSVVDLAAMRDAVVDMGKDPALVNPMCRCDLVIDHSVQVDYYGRRDALALNEKLEFARNKERYVLLKWAQKAFHNFTVVPPATGIVHQVNLEYISKGVAFKGDVVCPDSCVGTDSHTPMVNGVGVLAWGVGGIEAEAVMLGQPIYMLVPEVVGVKLKGKLSEGVTATDLVLYITETLRQVNVVGKFVEFFGSGLDSLSVPDRATIANMSPEHGCTVTFFPVDDRTLEYFSLTGKDEKHIQLVERFYKQQSMFRESGKPDPHFSQVIEIELGDIKTSVAGPKRPQDRIEISELGDKFKEMLSAEPGPRGIGISKDNLSAKGTVLIDGEEFELSHGSVVIAAITSCTNTSNPSVMIGAGLVAKKAVELGLRVPKYVKTSLAPGSKVVTGYLEKSGLLNYLEELGFNVVGYGCTTCIGNSGPLLPQIEEVIKKENLAVASVLSGNRNFEGRVHPLTRANFLASPPLVVAYALAGSVCKNLPKDSITTVNGKEIFLKDIWPSDEEIRKIISEYIDKDIFIQKYSDVYSGSEEWKKITAKETPLFEWDPNSTYVRKPPFFEGIDQQNTIELNIEGARVLGFFGDSVTTDHISPAGAIAKDSPAAEYLRSCGVKEEDFNSYGSRRGNHEVMMRGTFANIRLRNRLVPDREGNITRCFVDGSLVSFYDAAMKYKQHNIPLIVVAGKEYGSGSSRDWAAKGPYLLGVKAVLAESFERIHRSNLVGMGILPLQFLEWESADSLKLTGEEVFNIEFKEGLSPRCLVDVTAKHPVTSQLTQFKALCRIDTPVEVKYIKDGGILRTVLKTMVER